jgi:iron complex outermembrane receptor protein
LLGTSAVLSAEATELLSEDLFFGDVPVVLSATRLKQPLKDTPAAITIIDRAMIDASGAIEVADLFRLVPGFQVAQYTGSKYSISYHGNADQFARDMQVLIDGRSIYDPGFGGVTWLDQELDIADILRIEIVRGPNAASYGSNSFAGVINIITQHPAEEPGLKVKTTIGEGQRRQIYSRYASSTENLSYRVGVKYDENSGYETRVDSSDTRWLALRADYRLDTHTELMLQLGQSKGSRGDGFVDDSIQPIRDTHDEHNYQQLRWTRNLPNDDQLYIQFYRNYQLIDDDFVDSDFLPPFKLLFGYGFKSLRYDLELQHTLNLASDKRLVWGLGSRLDRVKGFHVFNRSDWLDRHQLRGFSNLEWRLKDNLLLNLGGMVEKFQSTPLLFSPRIALNFAFDQERTFRLVANRAYRVPTFWEEFANQQVFDAPTLTPLLTAYMNDRDVKPEQITAFEVGFLGEFSELGMTLDMKLFREEIRDLVAEVKDKDTDHFKFINDGMLKINGLEIGVRWDPTPKSMFHLGYSLTHAYGKQVKKLPATHPLFDFRILNFNVPTVTLSLIGSHEFDNGIKLSSALYYMEDINWAGDGDFIKAHRRWDVKLGKKYKLTKGDAEVSLIMQNIGSHNDFRDFYAENIWTDRFFLQAEFNWH